MSPQDGGASPGNWRCTLSSEPPIFLDGTLATGQVRARVAVHTLSGLFWHQGAVRFPLDSCADPANTMGRYHIRGGPGVWYGSSHERSAWAELMRHFEPGGVSPFEIRRRVGRVRVQGLRILDLTDGQILDEIGVEPADLTADDYGVCQALSRLASGSRLDGLLAPSAALPGEQTLAVFAHCLRPPMLTAEHSRVQVPPSTLVDWLQLIRPVPGTAGAMKTLYDELARRGRSALRGRVSRGSAGDE